LLRLLPFPYSDLPLLSSVVIGSHGADEAPVFANGANQFKPVQNGSK